MPVAAQEATETPPPSAPVPSSEPPQVETLPGATASPLPDSIRPPAESRIAYVTGETGTSPTIHVIAPDGSVDASVAPGTLPSWAPDSEHLAYTCKPERWDYFGSVCIRHLPSGTSTVVIAHGTLPLWSPAGGLIAFSRDVWALGDAWIYRAEPRATWKLPGGMPEWSPTGRWLRFLTARGMPERPVIHVVRPDGSGARSLGRGWNATWSPDGRRIATTWWDGASSSVTAIQIKTGARDWLFETDAHILALGWLPGDGLAFLAEHEASSTGDLRIVELSSGVVRSLTSGLAVTPDLTARVSADDLAKAMAPVVGGRGGGKPDLAQAGGKDPDRIEAALEAGLARAKEKLGATT